MNEEGFVPPPKEKNLDYVIGRSPEKAAAEKRAEKKANCKHLTITTNRKTGQARCYSCGKWMPNALLSKDQQRLDKFMEAE